MINTKESESLLFIHTLMFFRLTKKPDESDASLVIDQLNAKGRITVNPALGCVGQFSIDNLQFKGV